MEWVSEHHVAVLAVKNSCDARHRKLKSYLQNEHVLGSDEHPTSLSEAFKLLNNYVPLKSQAPNVSVLRKTAPNTDDEEHESWFFQKGEDGNEDPIVLSADGKVHPNIKCNCCQELGHCKAQCPKLKGKNVDKEANLLQLEDGVHDLESDNKHEAMC